MATALAGAAGRGAPCPSVVGGVRPGDVRHVFASPEHATNLLGFTAKVDFTAGMAELWRHRCERHPADDAHRATMPSWC